MLHQLALLISVCCIGHGLAGVSDAKQCHEFVECTSQRCFDSEAMKNSSKVDTLQHFVENADMDCIFLKSCSAHCHDCKRCMALKTRVLRVFTTANTTGETTCLPLLDCLTKCRVNMAGPLTLPKVWQCVTAECAPRCFDGSCPDCRRLLGAAMRHACLGVGLSDSVEGCGKLISDIVGKAAGGAEQGLAATSDSKQCREFVECTSKQCFDSEAMRNSSNVDTLQHFVENADMDCIFLKSCSAHCHDCKPCMALKTRVLRVFTTGNTTGETTCLPLLDCLTKCRVGVEGPLTLPKVWRCVTAECAPRCFDGSCPGCRRLLGAAMRHACLGVGLSDSVEGCGKLIAEIVGKAAGNDTLLLV